MSPKPTSTTSDALARALDSLGEMGYVRPGSLVRRFITCGKSNCHCQDSPEYRHGPYLQWTARINGRTVTRLLTLEQATHCRRWVANRKRLLAWVERLERISLKETDRILDKLVTEGRAG